MKTPELESPIITGAPLIGEGNVVDSKSFISILGKAGMPVIGFYPNGPMVSLARRYHISISMSMKKTVAYAMNSEADRSSLMVLPLKLELRNAVRKTHRRYPDAPCFITSQDMMAEESVGAIGDTPSIMCSSDAYGKIGHESRPSERQREITYFVWNRESFDLYKNVLNLRKVYLINPVDPKDAFAHIERIALPFQEALDEPRLCYIKLSGSGGDAGLVSRALISLWKNSGVRSIVFPGTEKARRRIAKTAGEDAKISCSLDPAVYYNHIRKMISGEQMLLACPSEQVKHVAVLTRKNIFPRVAWLPPRGRHEAINLAWAIKKGLSGTVCVPREFQGRIKSILIDLGVSAHAIEFVVPEKLRSENFRLSQKWQDEREAVDFESAVRYSSNL